MTKQIFEQTLDQYTKELGLTDVQHDDVHGVCLEFDQKIELSMQWNKEISMVHAYIFCDYVPKRNEAVLFESLLSANFLWTHTGGATLSIDKNTNGIVLIAKWGDDVYKNAESLKSNIDNLVNHAELWQNHIKQIFIQHIDNDMGTHSFSTQVVHNSEALL